MRILVTGGAGFIGSHFVDFVLKHLPTATVTVLDNLTYAGSLSNLAEAFKKHPKRLKFVKGDVCNTALTGKLCKESRVTFHFAAESFVDRSLFDAGAFVRTNVEGTATLLSASLRAKQERFVYVSTDEVYGSTLHGSFSEASPVVPRNPYAASKAAADLLAFSYHATYGLPVIITRSSNNFGPRQHPEKFIPLFISHALLDRPLPLYGDGKNVRDWLYVGDNCEGIWTAFRKGKTGEVYNVGGEAEKRNIDVARTILAALGKPESLIRYVKDRPGHDRRYSLDCRKISALGFSPSGKFEDRLRETVAWYKTNMKWWQGLQGKKAFKKHYERHYVAQRRLK